MTGAGNNHLNTDDIPSAGNAFEKRLKRRVIGRKHQFFVATAPGFEPLCRDELKSLSVFTPEVDIREGGIEFEGHVHECYIANLCLHTASRILMRIREFKASNFRQLEKKLAEIDWELYFSPETTPQIRVTTRNSRLFHTQAIAGKVNESITQRLSGLKTEGYHNVHLGSSQIVFIRAVHDCFSLSLDSSGELLYKRGIKEHGGRAPVRETIAAAALQLAGYTGDEPLVDPMCGSGTFSIEGALTAHGIPPGWYRSFGFMGWPFFRKQRWEYLRKQVWSGELKTDKPLIFASDQDGQACSVFEKTISKYLFSSSITIRCRDFFDLLPGNIDENLRSAGLMVINPPYGLRMGERDLIKKFIPEVLNKLAKDFKGWKLAMIMPEKVFLDMVPFNFKAYPFIHGGLHLHLVVGKI